MNTEVSKFSDSRGRGSRSSPAELSRKLDQAAACRGVDLCTMGWSVLSLLHLFCAMAAMAAMAGVHSQEDVVVHDQAFEGTRFFSLI